MEALTVLTTYDYVILGLFALLIGRGIWLGLLRQVTGLLALYLGYFAAGRYHHLIAGLLEDVSRNPKVIFLASYVIMFILTYLVVMLLGKGLGYVMQMTITSWFDRVLGGLVGAAKAVIIVVVVHMILGTVLAPENRMLKTCYTCEYLNSTADFTRALIQDEEVRQSLLQKDPAIAIDAVKNLISLPK